MESEGRWQLSSGDCPQTVFSLYTILQMLPRALFDFILSRTYRTIRG